MNAQRMLFWLMAFCLAMVDAEGRSQSATDGLLSKVYIDTSIENASPLWYELDEAGRIAIHLLYDHERNAPNRAAGHIHFAIEGPAATPVEIEFHNLENIYNGRPGSVANEMHRLVVSEDGHKWTSVETEVLEHRVRLRWMLTGGRQFIARVEPYRLSDLDRLLERLKAVASERVQVEGIGKTIEGRPLEVVRIGKQDAAHHLFFRARAHPWEAGGNWVIEGLIAALLRGDRRSEAFLNGCCVWIMPMANKDGVARGRTRFNMAGRDLNRNWDLPANPETSPENFALEQWLEKKLSSGLRFDFAMEIHNDGNGRLHHSLPPPNDRARYLARIDRFENLLRKHTWFTTGHNEGSLSTYSLANGWQNRFGIDGAVHEFNCQWIEKLGVGPLKEHWMSYGDALIDVFHEFLDL